jgi:circadian clock protein KaiC
MRAQATESRKRQLDRRRAAVERQIADLRSQLDDEEFEANTLLLQDEARESSMQSDRVVMGMSRKVKS